MFWDFVRFQGKGQNRRESPVTPDDIVCGNVLSRQLSSGGDLTLKQSSIVPIEVKYPEIGICGLSCRLCPGYHRDTASRCPGCKTRERIASGCPFITCALKRKKVEFCWDCDENSICERWKRHREIGKKFDSFKCYQSLEEDIAFVEGKGIGEFEKVQKVREKLLTEMLQEFDDGRSKSYYCIAATIMDIGELKELLNRTREVSNGWEVKEKARLLHGLLDALARKRGYCLRLRKQPR